MKKEDLQIIFMGTPEFAVESLKILHENKFNIVGVITSPDKPAGRGKTLRESDVKQYAVSNNLPVLQPVNLKDPGFIRNLEHLKPDLQIVVAFRMLPEMVWSLPKLGTINLHASLLPDYRGAAPINWAIINGENKTGLTTFFIEKEIDTGNILLQEETEIHPEETAGHLHDRLMHKGAQLVLQTIHKLMEDNLKPTPQKDLMKGMQPKSAPKIFKEDCKIDWEKNLDSIFNFIRGLSPYPAAWTELRHNDQLVSLKIFVAEKIYASHSLDPGTFDTDFKSYLKIAVNGGFISIKEIQQAGKRKLKIDEFLRGFANLNHYRLIS